MKKTKDSAVSPVIGVLLMLVVTIIIAAVVSGFAGGLAGTQQKAPQASMAVKTGWSVDDKGGISTQDYDFSVEHLGGDPINTKECQLITFLTLPNGTVVKHVQSATSPYTRLGQGGPTGTEFWTYSRVPHVYDQQKYGYPCSKPGSSMGYTPGLDSGDLPAWFGKAVWMPGDIARTYRLNGTAALLGLVPDANMYPGTNAGDEEAFATAGSLMRSCISNNTPVEVKLLHVPSGKYILDKKISLQG